MRLLIVSPIPLYVDANGGQWSLDLWIIDIAANARHVTQLTVLAPRGVTSGANYKPWPTGVAVKFEDEVTNDPVALAALVAEHDVISISSGRPRWRMRIELRVALATGRAGKKLVTSVTSNRALTTILNAQGQSLLKRLKARFQASSVLRTTRILAARSDAVMVIGAGVANAMGLDHHPSLQIEIASWIDSSSIVNDAVFERRCQAVQQRRGPPTACFAGRLEPMKGAHLGIDALVRVTRLRAGVYPTPSLSIFGQGPALADLRQQAERLKAHVRFEGVRAYPHAFLSAIGAFDLVLMTNLNDEQPRLVFDAISQGTIPLCPDTLTYRALGLPNAVYFKRGDAEALAAAWSRFYDPHLCLETMRELRPLAFEFTVESMHRRRATWMRALVKD